MLTKIKDYIVKKSNYMLSKATVYPILDEKPISFIYERERAILKRKKFKVGDLYAIEQIFSSRKDKLIYIFIEDTDDGANKVFYCPENNQHFNVDSSNNWALRIKKYE